MANMEAGDSSEAVADALGQLTLGGRPSKAELASPDPGIGAEEEEGGEEELYYAISDFKADEKDQVCVICLAILIGKVN